MNECVLGLDWKKAVRAKRLETSRIEVTLILLSLQESILIGHESQQIYANQGECNLQEICGFYIAIDFTRDIFGSHF